MSQSPVEESRPIVPSGIDENLSRKPLSDYTESSLAADAMGTGLSINVLSELGNV